MKKSTHIFFTGIICLLIVACAKIGAPPGGDKDETPPKVVKSSPLNYSTSYNQNKIVVSFDEYINLKSAYTEFTISPPLEENPVPIVNGKKLVIELPSKDLDSLTYTMDFGQSIEDNNEGNKLPNFQFVISKLPYIDTFSVSGAVLDAFTKLPSKDPMFVQLRKNLVDTAFGTIIPTYHGKTDPEGKFQINHLAPGTYNIFTLKDANNNMLFDMPNEIIAFSNEPIILHPDSFANIEPIVPEIDSAALTNLSDTLKLDSILVQEPLSDTLADSTLVDSTLAADSLKLKLLVYSFNMYTFTEAKDYNLILEDYKRENRESLSILFTENLEKAPELRLLKPDTTGVWYYLEDNPTHDTLTYWLADSNLVLKDSILAEITHAKSDSTGEIIYITDTLLFRSKPLPKPKKTDKEEKKSGGLLGKITGGDNKKKIDTLPKPPPRFKLDHNAKSSGHDLNVPIVLTTESPVFNINRDKFDVVQMEDTVEVPVKFSVISDSANFRKFRIKMDFEPETNYILKLYEGSLTDIYTRTIDTTLIRFTTQSEDYYGVVNMDVNNINSPTIIQLLSEKEVILKKLRINANQRIKFDYLKPGKYFVKAIADWNDNGKWDAGIFEERLQPEQVEYFPQIIEVRSNWEVEYTFEFPANVTSTRPVTSNEEEKKEKDTEKDDSEEDYDGFENNDGFGNQDNDDFGFDN